MRSVNAKIKGIGLLAVLLLGGIVYSDMPMSVKAAEPRLPQLAGADALACAPVTPEVDYVETPESSPEQYIREYIPLTPDVQTALFSACDRAGIDYAIALGLIQVESGFVPDAINNKSGCYGLCQLNPEYFPTGLPPAENVERGIMFLGDQLNRYGDDLAAALTAYNAGHDTGRRDFAEAVLAAAESWAEVLE